MAAIEWDGHVAEDEAHLVPSVIDEAQALVDKLDGMIESEKRYIDNNRALDIAHAAFCEGKINAFAAARNDVKNILKRLRARESEE